MGRNWALTPVAVVVFAIWFGVWRRKAEPDSNADSSRLRPGVEFGSGQFFDSVAPRYDLINRFISLGLDRSWRREVVRVVRPATRNALALDVATGTGELAILLHEDGSYASVHAIDPSPGMLSLLRNKGHAQIQVAEGVAENLPYENETFDVVTVAFGLRNFADREKGVGEIARVLKPGGRLAILEAVSPKEKGPLAFLTRFFVGEVMPRMAAILSGSLGDSQAYMYLKDSMARFPGNEVVFKMLSDTGLYVQSHRRLWPFSAGPHLYVAVRGNSHGATTAEPALS